MAGLPSTIVEAALRVLNEPDPDLKASLTERYAAAWRSGAIAGVAPAAAWEVPSRPARPDDRVRLVKPWLMPAAGRGGSRTNRVAMLHALVHIESWAVDLAWDAVARFADAPAGAEAVASGPGRGAGARPLPADGCESSSGESSSPAARTFSRPSFDYGLPRAFFDDFVAVADDEARHYRLLKERLEAHGATYGDLPAHDGLWESAERTAHSLPARLAVEHCTHEARGLDRLPVTIARFRSGGDRESAALMEDVIYAEEITHCAAGVRWIKYLFEKAHASEEGEEGAAAASAVGQKGAGEGAAAAPVAGEKGAGEGAAAAPVAGEKGAGEQPSAAAIDGRGDVREEPPSTPVAGGKGAGDELSAALATCRLAAPSAAPTDPSWRSDARTHAVVEEWFHALVRAYFYGGLKPPFNDAARAKAGFDPSWYLPLAEDAPNAPKARKPPGKAEKPPAER